VHPGDAQLDLTAQLKTTGRQQRKNDEKTTNAIQRFRGPSVCRKIATIAGLLLSASLPILASATVPHRPFPQWLMFLQPGNLWPASFTRESEAYHTSGAGGPITTQT